MFEEGLEEGRRNRRSTQAPDRGPRDPLVHLVARIGNDIEIANATALGWNLENGLHRPDRDQILIDLHEAIPMWTEPVFDELFVTFESGWNRYRRFWRRRT